MRRFEWSHAHAAPRVQQLPADSVVYVISDLHLGDGSHSDTFLGKDRHLLRFLDKVRQEEGAVLIVNGDIIDFAQSRDFARILSVHGAVFRAMADLAEEDRFFYVYGNHDFDMRLYRNILRFPVVATVLIGDQIRIDHGHQYDPMVLDDLVGADTRTRRHHLTEHLFRTWIRLPLGHFYTLAGRLSFYFAYRGYQVIRACNRLLDDLGLPGLGKRALAHARYWIRSEKGDPGNMWAPVSRALKDSSYSILVCGHSHMPGVVEVHPDRYYVNTGSWTFDSSTFMRWEPDSLPVIKDWLTGREFGDRLYERARSGYTSKLEFEDWWEEEYLGFLRFRCGEARRGKLPTWTVPPAAVPPAAAPPAVPSGELSSLADPEMPEENP
jgi:UDP-2,3-diacylglucosamine pyrophosphatase LpxH